MYRLGTETTAARTVFGLAASGLSAAEPIAASVMYKKTPD
jgi:hypothetical protein